MARMAVGYLRRPCNWLVACLMLLGGVVPAFGERLDDSASPRARVQASEVLSERGRPLSDDADARFAVIRFGRVEYKLVTARHIGRRARIYLVVPANIPGLRSPSALRVEWRGNGLFSDGSAVAGERRLVWNGTVRSAWMTESLDLGARVDLRELSLPSGGNLGFESFFEIEVLP